MHARRILLVSLTGLLAGAGGYGALPPIGRRMVASGADSPVPAVFRQNLAEFEKLPFDGTTIVPVRRLADGTEVDCRGAFSREPWQPAELDPMVAQLKAAAPQRARENFLLVSVSPGDVDWFDDAGWREITDHWRLLARAAKQGGLRGLWFEPGPAGGVHEQFRLAAQAQRDRKDFAAYAVKARERGREVMQAAAAEFPEMTLFACRLLSELVPVLAPGSDPTEFLLVHRYGLLPAFVDGWLDAAPPKLAIVEGNEGAGFPANGSPEFDRWYVLARGAAAGLLAPENRPKFRAQVLIGQTQLLDGYASTRADAAAADADNGVPLARIEAGALAALRASDGWLRVHGDSARWWPAEPGTDSGPVRPPWPEKLPGVTEALARARQPAVAARERLALASPAENLLKNPDFTKTNGGGRPDDWLTWQSDGSAGNSYRDDAGGVVTGAWSGAAQAAFTQELPAKPGEVFALGARVKKQGLGAVVVRVSWKDARGKSVAAADLAFPAEGATDSEGWRTINGLVRVPPGVAHMVVKLCAEGQVSPEDRAWFSEAKLVRM